MSPCYPSLMPFNGLNEVEKRLEDPTPLAPHEARELLPWINQISETGMRQLNARLILQNLEAFQKTEKSNRKLTLWLTGLTAVLAILAIATFYNSFVRATSQQVVKDTQNQSEGVSLSSAKKTLGPWRVKFGVPGSAEVPEKSPILKYSFEGTNAGYIAVTAENLSDRSCAVKYSIYGYDQDGRRISEGSDEFTIGKRETVLRKVLLLSQQASLGQLGSTFSIQVVLEQ